MTVDLKEREGKIMRYDYHMHFEKGSYDVDWAKGFFEAQALLKPQALLHTKCVL